jgi:hypothetical protein
LPVETHDLNCPASDILLRLNTPNIGCVTRFRDGLHEQIPRRIGVRISIRFAHPISHTVRNGTYLDFKLSTFFSRKHNFFLPFPDM